MNYLFVLDLCYLIKNGLTSSTFGENEIKSYGISVACFKEINDMTDTIAMTKKCG